jgi:hypothetical protein
MDNKVIYLKSLFKDFKPNGKLQTLINTAIANANGVDENSRPKEAKGSVMDTRKFILNNAEEFLWYAIDYSMADKFNDLFIKE